MQTFYSHGKLLLTGEYVVLDGANALALPTQFGQTLQVEAINTPEIIWQSIGFDGVVWFEDVFFISNDNGILLSSGNDTALSNRLINILQAAKNLNPEFLKTAKGYKVTSVLEFPNNWGLGSSSTLLNNIAQWAKIDAFALSNATFGGSGYDIACAKNDTAIVYTLKNEMPNIKALSFNKPFQERLFFVHLNRKQNSRNSIKTYQDNKGNTDVIISKINNITDQIIETDDFETFQDLLNMHEALIGEITNQTPIKERLFSDYLNTIKSLGGWNGDFVLVTGNEAYVNSYFKTKGYHTIISYKEMILHP